jgi:hypothetical protein
MTLTALAFIVSSRQASAQLKLAAFEFGLATASLGNNKYTMTSNSNTTRKLKNTSGNAISYVGLMFKGSHNHCFGVKLNYWIDNATEVDSTMNNFILNTSRRSTVTNLGLEPTIQKVVWHNKFSNLMFIGSLSVYKQIGHNVAITSTITDGNQQQILTTSAISVGNNKRFNVLGTLATAYSFTVWRNTMVQVGCLNQAVVHIDNRSNTELHTSDGVASTVSKEYRTVQLYVGWQYYGALRLNISGDRARTIRKART